MEQQDTCLFRPTLVQESCFSEPSILEKFDGKPIKALEKYIKNLYPLAEFQFHGGGRIFFTIGLCLGNYPLVIHTNFYLFEIKRKGKWIEILDHFGERGRKEAEKSDGKADR